MGNLPDPNDIWLGIAGHFDTFTQVLCEFIDNSISNYMANNSSQRNVLIILNEDEDDNVFVRVEDSGTGLREIIKCLTLGNKSLRESPFNEHGFGLKHALATANPSNNSWTIYTRTQEDISNARFSKITCPYTFEMKPVEIKCSGSSQWIGEFNNTGTVIEFVCSSALFNTVQLGIPGRATFKKCLDYIAEDLGFIYSGVIKSGKISITIKSNRSSSVITVAALEPNHKGDYVGGPMNINLDLGGGEIELEAHFMEIGDSKYQKYYRSSMSSSGVEIRLNGRLLEYNLFKEIWGKEKHNSYNHFLVKINIVSEHLDKLPKTRTSKNGIRRGDEKLEALYDWIMAVCPAPPKELTSQMSENDLVQELVKAKRQGLDTIAGSNVTSNHEVYTLLNSPVRVDIYLFDGTNIVLYEAKKSTAHPLSFYQLLMYWDGAVNDGLKPNVGKLVATDFSDGVKYLISLFNQKLDANGNNYNFVMRTWKEEGIVFPPP